MSLKSKLAVIGLAGAMVAGAAAPALAVTAYATTNVNVRSCGSTACRVVDVLRRGERVDVDYCEDAWCAVDKRGRDGWVNANYLSRGGDFYDDYDDDIDIYVSPRIYPRHHYPRHFHRHFHRHHGPDFSACVGGANARFCVFD